MPLAAAGVPAPGGVSSAGTWMRSPGEPGRFGVRRGVRCGVAGVELVILRPMMVDADASSMSRLLLLPRQRLALRMSSPACARRGLRAAREASWAWDPGGESCGVRGGGASRQRHPGGLR